MNATLSSGETVRRDSPAGSPPNVIRVWNGNVTDNFGVNIDLPERSAHTNLGMNITQETWIVISFNSDNSFDTSIGTTEPRFD